MLPVKKTDAPSISSRYGGLQTIALVLDVETEIALISTKGDVLGGDGRLV